MQFIFFRVLIKRIMALRFFIKDKKVPLRKKIIIVSGIVYLLSPLDLIPEPILLFGLVDDVVLWSFIIWYLKEELDKYWLGEDTVKPKKNFSGKTIIEDVNYEVKKEEEHS